MPRVVPDQRSKFENMWTSSGRRERCT
nr:core binding factor beta subunit isoform 6 [Danio rerio]